MFFRLAIILAIGLPAYHFSDMDSDSRFLAYVLPILSFASIIALAMWIIDWFAHIDGGNQ